MSTSQQAKLLGISGWVRNLEDGRVEVLASGEKPALDQLQKWLAQGPSPARVLNIESTAIDYQEYPDFTIR